jgi:hypothetical protein
MRYARRSRLGISLAAGLWLCALATAWRVDAAPLDYVPSMEVVRNKLELTPEQEMRLRPLFDQRLAELQQIRARVEQAPSKAEKRTVLRDAKQQAAAFNASVENLLTPSQKTKWRELRSQTREKLKERYEDQRESGG